MRWLRSFSLAFILFGLSFFVIAPSDAYAKNYIETNDADLYYMWFTEDELVDGMPYYKSWASLNRVLDYNYSATDIIDTHSEASADYVLAMAHTGAFGGYLDVPTVNSTASATFTSDLYNETGTTKISTVPYWALNQGVAYYASNGSSTGNLHLGNTKIFGQGMSWSTDAAGHHIGMQNATLTMSSTGTQTKEEETDTDGTLHHDEFYTNNYKMIPYDGTGDYLYVCLASPNSANIGLKDSQFFMPNTIMDYYRDGPTGSRAAFRYYKLCAVTTNNRYLQGTEDGYITFDRAYKYVGVFYSLNNATKPTNYILVSAPKFYVVDTDVEKTVRTETQTQTQELKDTTGSSTTVTGAQSVFDSTIKTKLGFVAQTADITTGIFDALTYEGDGTVPFPALQWQGQTIIAAQNVPILGYIPSIEDDVKTGVTLVLFLAWLHGIHSLYARLFLGETMVEVDEE